MPLAYVHLVHLSSSISLPAAIRALSSANPPPLILSRVIRWMIVPSTIDTSLLRTPWDLLLITSSPKLPSAIHPHLLSHYSLQVGIPSRLTNSLPSHNQALLHPEPKAVPALTGSLDKPRLGSTSQTLELSSDLFEWIEAFKQTHVGSGAMSMLNLLAFKPGAEHHESYKRYGQAFASSIGKRRGGDAKLVGNVVHAKSSSTSGSASSITEAKEWSGTKTVGNGGNNETAERWDEFALAHYPSIEHFADMLASEDYQAVNLKDRVPSLRDTCILCTSEIAVEEILQQDAGKSKL